MHNGCDCSGLAALKAPGVKKIDRRKSTCAKTQQLCFVQNPQLIFFPFFYIHLDGGKDGVASAFMWGLFRSPSYQTRHSRQTQEPEENYSGRRSGCRQHLRSAFFAVRISFMDKCSLRRHVAAVLGMENSFSWRPFSIQIHSS